VSDRSFGFLVNPAAGGGTAGEAVVPLARRLREAGAEVAVTYTSSPRQMPDLVRQTVDAGHVVVSVGGDGMVSSVAGSVADAGGVLAVVPAGRGNDFARMLAVPHEVDEQVALLLDGEPVEIDLLEASLPGQQPVVMAGSVYAGVDARAAAIVDRSRWVPSALQYPLAAVRALATYRPVDATLEVDGSLTRHRAATVVIANSGYYGKGMRIAPAAALDDGELDVVVIEAASRWDLIRSLPKVYDGSHAGLPEVTMLRGRKVRLSGAYVGGGPVPVGADGEELGDLPLGDGALEVNVRPGALRVLA
jgi:diacylglycerol kinase (ATP)